MKTKATGIICLFVIIGAWAFVHAQATIVAAPSLPAGANGRYQVIAADIDSEGMGGTLKHKTAIRIDSQTGRTWDLVEIPGREGGSNFYWQELQEDK
jgi:hypothetical protein